MSNSMGLAALLPLQFTMLCYTIFIVTSYVFEEGSAPADYQEVVKTAIDLLQMF